MDAGGLGRQRPAAALDFRAYPLRLAVRDPHRYSQAAFDAIASTMPLGSVGYENDANERGERLIWLALNVVDRLRALRGPGESYSDVILRLAKDS